MTEKGPTKTRRRGLRRWKAILVVIILLAATLAATWYVFLYNPCAGGQYSDPFDMYEVNASTSPNHLLSYYNFSVLLESPDYPTSPPDCGVLSKPAEFAPVPPGSFAFLVYNESSNSLAPWAPPICVQSENVSDCHPSRGWFEVLSNSTSSVQSIWPAASSYPYSSNWTAPVLPVGPGWMLSLVSGSPLGYPSMYLRVYALASSIAVWGEASIRQDVPPT